MHFLYDLKSAKSRNPHNLYFKACENLSLMYINNYIRKFCAFKHKNEYMNVSEITKFGVEQNKENK